MRAFAIFAGNIVLLAFGIWVASVTDWQGAYLTGVIAGIVTAFCAAAWARALHP